MRLILRAGFVLGLAATACGKDSPAPTDFNNPAAVSANLQSVDSAFDTDVFRSFTNATLMLDAAASPALRPVATLLQATRPKLERAGGQAFLPGILQASRMRAVLPNLSVSAAQGRIIHDSMYGRVFEWDATLHEYTYQGGTVASMTGVRFVLYATGLDGTVVEPVSAIGTLDIIDQSTLSKLQLQVLVKGPGGTTTYVDYTVSLVSSQTSATATASGEITNGLSAGANKTLSFDETFTVNANGASVHSTFALNSPATTLMLNESVTFDEPNIVVNADFRIIQNAETIRTFAHLVFDTLGQSVNVDVTVYVDGHPVASVHGDPSLPGVLWVDAGGEPLTLEDLDALDRLFDGLEAFQEAVGAFFLPVSTLANL